MPDEKQHGPIAWAISFGIVVLCSAAAFSISSNCRPVSIEIFKAIKSNLGNCTAKDLTAAVDTQKADALDIDRQILSARVNSEIRRPMSIGSAERPTISTGLSRTNTVNFDGITVGSVYVLTDKLNPGAFNAPLHSDKPSFGKMAPVVGKLTPGVPFEVVRKLETSLFRYKWVGIQLKTGRSSATTLWLPWGQQETPFVPVDT